MGIILSSADLSRKFDEAIKDLEKNNTEELIELGGLLYQLGCAKKDPICELASLPLANFGTAFMDFYPLIATPHLLFGEMKPEYDSTFKTAKNEAMDAIKQLKKEFCDDGNPDYEKITRSLGILQRHQISLINKRARYMRSQPPLPSFSPPEE